LRSLHPLLKNFFPLEVGLARYITHSSMMIPSHWNATLVLRHSETPPTIYFLPHRLAYASPPLPPDQPSNRHPPLFHPTGLTSLHGPSLHRPASGKTAQILFPNLSHPPAWRIRSTLPSPRHPLAARHGALDSPPPYNPPFRVPSNGYAAPAPS